jgi:fibronectin-binding autotransporter adhesin
MATRTWSSAGSTDMSDGANYSGSGNLLPEDDLVFDATSTVNATATAALVVRSITTTVAYTGNWSSGGFAITTATTQSYAGTGTLTLSGTNTMTGDGDLIVASTVGTFVAGSLVLQGTGAWTINKAPSTPFVNVTLAAAGKTTTYNAGASHNPVMSGTFTVGAGTFTLTAEFFKWHVNGGLVIDPGATINGVGRTFWIVPNSGTAMTLPDITLGGSLNFAVYKDRSSNQSVTLGNLTVPGNAYFRNARTAAETLTITVGAGKTIAITGATEIGVLYAGSGGFVLNAGNGVISIGSLTTANQGTETINWGTASITCTGSLTIGANWTVDPGTSLFTITGTSTITSNGKSFYDLTINAPAATVVFADNITLASGGDLTITAGTLNMSGDTVTVGSDITVNSAATLTIDATSAFVVLGNGVISTGGKSFPQTTINGNTAINGGNTIARLIYGTDGKTITWQSGQTFTISNLTAANWNGADGNLNAFRSSTPGTQYALAIPGAVTLEYMNPQDCAVTGYEITANDGTSVNGGNNSGWLFPARRAGGWRQKMGKFGYSGSTFSRRHRNTK